MNRLGFFVGRKFELDELASILEDALSGRFSFALVVGEAGIGKTRIVHEFARQAAEEGIPVAMGTCVEGHETPSYGPWREALSNLPAPTSSMTIPALFGQSDRATAMVAPGDLTFKRYQREQASVPADRSEFLVTVAQLVAQLASDTGLLIVLENLQWADPDSITLLEDLAQKVASSGIMVIATARDSDLTLKHPFTRVLGELVKLPTFCRIHLEGLSRSETAEYVKHALDWPYPNAAAETIYARSEGTPLFMIEMVRDLLARGSDATVPRVAAGIRDFVGRRLAGLSEACVEALSVAAVIGRRFDSSLLARLVDASSADQVTEVLCHAEKAGFIEELENQVWQFTHVLVQEALYDDLPAARRWDLHEHIARLMEGDYVTHPSGHCGELLRHLFAGLGSPRATFADAERIVRLTVADAESALTECAPERALRVLGRTLRLVDTSGRFAAGDATLAELLHLQGRALHEAGRPEGRESLIRAFDLYASAGDTEHAVEVALTRSHHRLHSINGEVAVSLGPVEELRQRALSLVEPDSCDEGRLLSAGWDRDGLDRALRIARREHDEVLETWTLARLAEFHGYHGAFGTSVALWRRVVDQARAWGDRSALNWFLYMYTLPLAVSGRLADARSVCLRLVENARFARSPRLQWRAHYASAALAGMAGDWAACREHSEKVFSLHPANTTTFSGAFARLNLGLVEYETGNPDAGKRLLQASAAWAAGPVGKGFPCAEVKIARITDDAARLEELARRLKLTAEPPGPGPFGFWQAAWHVTRASLAALVGDRTMAASERAYFERWIGCFPLGMTGRSYRAMPGLVESNLCELDAAVGHLKSAVVFCRSSGFRPELAWTCLDLAETLLLRGASGDEEAASRTLDEGGAVARSLGMSPLITKIEACRNRIAETPAWRDSLSSREAEVLRLVSRGYTNREIGEELYISERTVANHIGNILGKLGASNRAEAAAWAVSHGVDEGSG